MKRPRRNEDVCVAVMRQFRCAGHDNARGKHRPILSVRDGQSRCADPSSPVDKTTDYVQSSAWHRAFRPSERDDGDRPCSMARRMSLMPASTTSKGFLATAGLGCATSDRVASMMKMTVRNMERILPGIRYAGAGCVTTGTNIESGNYHFMLGTGCPLSFMPGGTQQDPLPDGRGSVGSGKMANAVGWWGEWSTDWRSSGRVTSELKKGG